MYVPRVNTKLCSTRQAYQLSRAVAPLVQTSSITGLRLATSSTTPNQQRTFSSTPVSRLRDFYPIDANVKPGWPHHGFTTEQMEAVEPGHRPPKTLGDHVAWRFIRFCRWGMDTCTGLSPDQQSDKSKPTTATAADKPLTEAQWVCHHPRQLSHTTTCIPSGNLLTL